MLDYAGCVACKKMFETEMPWLNPVLTQHIVRRFLSSGSTPKTIIDMGMGPGYLVKELAEVTNARLIGVDCNPIMLELTQALLAAHKIPNERVALCLDDVHHLAFPDNFADLMVSFGCMHHWRNPVVGVRECIRVLKPSGTLFFIDALSATHATIRHLEEQIRDQEVLWILKKAALEGFSRCRVKDIFTSAGVHEVHVGYAQFAHEDFMMCMDVLSENQLIGKYKPREQFFSSWEVVINK
jgi:ubiquinone/menaquinone biosynthesis C-methylase UbiE